MPKALLIFLLLVPVAAIAQLSNVSADLDFLKGRNFLFHFVKDGREYTKVFTCAQAAIVTSTFARLPCEAGFGEKWSAFAFAKSISTGPQYFGFWQGESESVPVNTYMYSFSYDGSGIDNGHYRQALPGGFSDALFGYARWIDINEEESGSFMATGIGPLSHRLYNYPPPLFAAGNLYIDNVQVGNSFYRVLLKQAPTTDGSILLRVESATKR